MKDDAWIVQQFLNERGARELSGHGAALAAFDCLRDRLAAAERERNEAREDRDSFAEQLALRSESQMRADLQEVMKAHNASLARATRLTEALEKARDGLAIARNHMDSVQHAPWGFEVLTDIDADLADIDAALKG
jgi:rubrerythrin